MKNRQDFHTLSRIILSEDKPCEQEEKYLMSRFSVKLLVAMCLVILVAQVSWGGDVHLSVATSLKDVVNELTDSFARVHPDVKFLKNYGGSGALAKQIVNGAPADLFISANLEWMEYLKDRKLVDTAGIGAFAYNTLVFAGIPAGKIEKMDDLLKLEKIAIGSPKSVPAGEYAMEAIRKAGLDKQLEKKLVMARDVRECLMYAERGEVEGAFVYRTDALPAKQVKILFIVPQGLYSRVTYAMALTVAGVKKKEAEDFYKYLQSDDAKAVLGKHGFALR
jgi:molybdate transport system substrate-binding protein